MIKSIFIIILKRWMSLEVLDTSGSAECMVSQENHVFHSAKAPYGHHFFGWYVEDTMYVFSK